MGSACFLENETSDESVGLKQKDRKLRRLRLILCVMILISWAIFAFTPSIGSDAFAGGIVISIIVRFSPLSLLNLIIVFLAPLSIVAMLVFGRCNVKHHKAVFAIETVLMSLNALILMFLGVLQPLVFYGLFHHTAILLVVISLYITTASFILLLIFNVSLYKNTIKLKKLGEFQ